MHVLPGRPPDHLRQQPTPVRLVRLVKRWVVGSTVAGIRYPFERVPLYRRDRTPIDPRPPDLARALPGDPATVQRADDGVGPLFHRRYWIDVTDEELGPEALMATIARDVNRAAPEELGRFENADGSPATDLDVGDECVVNLPGPWDGPVRVVERTPTSLRLVTLHGHIEAGEIEFRTSRVESSGFLRFEIESWARSSALALHLMYDVVPVARELQLLMWARMCRAVATLSGGTVMTNVQVTTDRHDWPLDPNELDLR